MLNHETMFEYYHLFALANGTILDLPAGRTAFLTEPAPTTLRNTAMTAEEIYAEHDKDDPDHLEILYIIPEPDVKKPETRLLALGSPKNMTTLGDNEPESFWSPDGYRNRGPSCVSEDHHSHTSNLGAVLTSIGLWQQVDVFNHGHSQRD